ncbi:DUF6879 family protein [Streptomyces sp. NPDC001443]
MNDAFRDLRTAPARRLTRKEYLDHFWRTLRGDIHRFDKLERRQEFQEPGTESWEAFHRGDWETALALLDTNRTTLAEYYAALRRRGLVNRRVRVVELPVTAYLQWELHALHTSALAGEAIRVVSADAVRDCEQDGPLPELVLLGDSDLYEVLYTEEGVGDGCRHIGDPVTVERAARAVDALFQRGEDLAEFFDREIAPLPPPHVRTGRTL